MGELRHYSEKEKKESFKLNYQQIHTVNEFRDWYKKDKEKYASKNLIFRGVSEAKFKLYTSAQRLWWERDFVRGTVGDVFKWKEYSDFLELLLKHAKNWNSGLLAKFYNNLGIELNDFALFSFMQHYGIPSPLLDFTADIDVGIYFAFSSPVLEAKENMIENYVSLYILNPEVNKDRLADSKGQDLTLKSIYEQRKLFLFTEVNESAVSDDKIRKSNYTNTNFNIINQKGLFLFNFHPWIPLEMSNNTLGDPPYLNEIICIDFHKSITEYALSMLKRKDITKSFLFADFNQFRNCVKTTTLEKFSL